MATNKKDTADTPPAEAGRTQAVIEPEGDQGVQTRLVMMNKAKAPTPGARSEDQEANIQWVFKSMTPPKAPPPGEGEREAEANIKWVLKPMVARRGRGRGQAPPSIGSMKVPGKP